MRLIRLTLLIHLLSHGALWLAALVLLLAGGPEQSTMGQWYQVVTGALIIHLGSYHWVMAQWQEDLCEQRVWPSSIYTALITLLLGILILMFPALAVYCVVVAVALLIWQESWGAIAVYIQPWYLRLRWLQMASLLLTQSLVLLA